MKQATRLLQMPLQSIWADNREATREEDTRGWRRVGLGKHLRKGRSFVGLNSWDSGARRSQGTVFKSKWFISVITDREAGSLAKLVRCPHFMDQNYAGPRLALGRQGSSAVLEMKSNLFPHTK
jgi:hypothetical protein